MEDKLRNVLLLELNQSPSSGQNRSLQNLRAEYGKISSEMENYVLTLVSHDSNPLRATETELEMLRAENLRLSRRVKEQESAIVAFENAPLKTTKQANGVRHTRNEQWLNRATCIGRLQLGNQRKKL